MFCMSLFDIAGIQNFVFATKKAKENVGASSLLENVFECFLVEELLKKFPMAVTCWGNTGEFRMSSTAPPPAEIVYLGGGNALIAFQSYENAVALTQAFSQRVLEETGGGLSVAVAHHETNMRNFTEDMNILRQKLERRKFNLPHSSPLLGLAITREGTSDRLPAVKCGEGGDWISCPASKKRDIAKNPATLSRLAPEGFHFPVEFDRLGRNREGGESLLAVVHIDGNNMGQTINNYLTKGDGSYQDAISRTRAISTQIAETYQQTLRDTISPLASAETQERLQRKGVILEENTLPLRPLICAGDDVTFVCDGRIALSLTASFLKRLSDTKNLDGKIFTACAGIAVVKPHFPFYRAYRLSEELCKSAKAKAKGNDSEQPGSWLDFEVVYSGLPLDLHTYRMKKYSIPGLTPLPDLNKGKEYHLLWRPYFVAGSTKNNAPACAWSKAMQRLRQINGTDGMGKEWPRSKLKGLEEAFTMSKEDAASFYAECKSRGNFLCENEGDLFEGDRTKWFDPIDMLDIHIEIPSLEKGGEKD